MDSKQDSPQEETRYINGYNDGYLLSRFEPDLMTKIMQGREIKDNPYFEGLAAGQSAQAREMFKQNLEKSRAVQERIKGPKIR